MPGPPPIYYGWPRHTTTLRSRVTTRTVRLGTGDGLHSARIYGLAAMEVKEFHIGCSKTINLGNFNSLRIEASVTVALQPSDSLTEASAEAQKELKRLLEETYQAQYKHAESLA